MIAVIKLEKARRCVHQDLSGFIHDGGLTSRLSLWVGRNCAIIGPVPGRGSPVLLSAVAARAEQGAEGGPLLISSSSEVHGSVLSDTIVQRNCTLHVRGNLLGS